MAIEKIYWDSDAFLGYFKKEPDKQDLCEGVLEAANDGKILIITSALTLAEVLYVKGHPKLPPTQREMVATFFKSPFISVQNVTRNISESARDIVWDFEVRPKDAIHVATAIATKVSVMNTFDGKLLNKDKKIGDPALKIERPHAQTQRKLNLN